MSDLPDSVFPAIHRAAEAGDYATVRQVLDADNALVSQLTDDGDQPLHTVAWQGHLKITELLIDRGADVNAHGNQGKTPLHIAVQSAHPKLVSLLLHRGADPNAVDGEGTSVVHLALFRGERPMAKKLLKMGGSKDLTASMFLDKPADVIKRLRADPRLLETLQNKNQLLFNAIDAGNIEMVEFLVGHGIDPNYRHPTRGLLPIVYAAGLGPTEFRVKAVDLLLKHGAKPNLKDDTGMTLRQIARMVEDSELDVVLGQHGIEA